MRVLWCKQTDHLLEVTLLGNIKYKVNELAKDLAECRQASRIFDDSWDQKYVQGMPV